ncbi:uncharacterized protein EI90DRAFT_2931213, partial [Cantharellus anzutake]|uniref:uncharacterized protein n=1 Tax=Cantharellus anzutake TaxID=1750568 RepID=UPI0019043E4E
WSFGLCDFFGACQTCLFAVCCPCSAYGQNMSRLKYLGTPHSEGGTVPNAESLTYYAFMHFCKYQRLIPSQSTSYVVIPGCYTMISSHTIQYPLSDSMLLFTLLHHAGESGN